ncbi:MAG: hypothetical protein A3J48_01280 [Candidatus Doudnabacteria bacterium RIFCSPHIGHO2_02_FULL_46_11]|uniref:Ribonuclease J n=1 Tax=Candidatus Doudnabacteria bacterium RIFCSPHIGHO2_02_FULL_46_11 TaxID=1817832 RepID=A0A1F5P8I4_9BACT|nr:MAG: hypothetical protein A3J48_01280 [Candidatus Doudnabacteria bacterium RIFCSPHIGHO2_02_FULL_46_11]
MTGKHNLRIIPLGGLEGVGERNCMVLEYGNDIIVIDMGFAFPDESMLGVDYYIPDVRYLEERKKKIRGILISHGHLDHIGALPYLLPKIGDPPIYTLPLSAKLIERRLSEFDMLGRAKINKLKLNDEITLGAFHIRMFRVNHNIPDNVGFAIKTPVGLIIHSGDWKFDPTPVGEPPAEIDKLALYGKEGVKLLMSDSTNVNIPGYSISEKAIGEMIDRIFRETHSRIIFASFASLVTRVQEMFTVAAKYNRKVVVTGRSMIQTVEAAMEGGYLKIDKGILIKPEQAKSFPDNQVVILTTGGQGEEFSALARMSRGEHRQIDIKANDLVVISASVIPGNENSVQTMMSNLTRLNARVIYQKILDIHTGGHAKEEEHKWMLSLTKPEYIMPIHAEHFMMVHMRDVARDMGIAEDKIMLMENGQVMEVSENEVKVTRERVPAELVFVDGLGVGDIGEVVLRDRQMMAEDGMLVLIITIDKKGGKLAAAPDIISRGFVHMKTSEDFLREIKHEVRKIVESKAAKNLEPNWAWLRNEIRDQLGEFIFTRTERRPMILPVIIEV